MSKERYVAAIEVSSSKIMAVVGKVYDTDGHVEVIATEQERSVEGVRYGIVQNLEETSMRITQILERLERKPSIAPRTITSAFVGLSGRSLRSITTTVSQTLPTETEITQDILDRLRRQALDADIDAALNVVDAIPRTYKIGKYYTSSPKGSVGSDITATYDLIVCRPEMQRNLTRTISEKSDLEIKGFVVTALSTAQVILTSEEKRQGCMLVDMGAETTTVTIYKNGHLAYFATLPMGGRNITRDITSLTALEEKAEEIKLTSGNAMAYDSQSTLNLSGLKMSEVSSIIVARAEEIVANIIEQITYASLKESDLPGGIICIGGGSKLNGIIDLLATKTGLPVRRGHLPSYITVTDSRAPMSEVLQAISILYAGAMNSDEECLEIVSNQDLPVIGEENPEDKAEAEKNKRKKERDTPRWFAKISDRMANMFGGKEDDSDLL